MKRKELLINIAISSIPMILLFIYFLSINESDICTPTQQQEQILEKLEAMEENKFYVDNMNDLNINAIKERLESIDMGLQDIHYACQQ